MAAAIFHRTGDIGSSSSRNNNNNNNNNTTTTTAAAAAADGKRNPASNENAVPSKLGEQKRF